MIITIVIVFLKSHSAREGKYSYPIKMQRGISRPLGSRQNSRSGRWIEQALEPLNPPESTDHVPEVNRNEPLPVETWRNHVVHALKDLRLFAPCSTSCRKSRGPWQSKALASSCLSELDRIGSDRNSRKETPSESSCPVHGTHI